MSHSSDLVISASSYDTWHTCPRMYYWKYVVRLLRVREDGARRLGTLIHAGLEAWWRNAGSNAPWRDADLPLVQAMHALADNARHVDTEPTDVAKAEALLIGYHARYLDLEFEPARAGHEGTEESYDLPLLDGSGRVIEGWRIIGRKDDTKRFGDGRVRVVEHKSANDDISAGSDYWLRIAVDTQVSMYIDAAQRSGLPECSETLYDVLKKPMLRLQLETPADRREYTKGKGCKGCGGRAGGKLGVLKGAGRILVPRLDDDGKRVEVEAPCELCNGTGWKLDDDGKPDEPRLHKAQRLADEPITEFRDRIAAELASDPDGYYRQARIVRTPDEIREMREDVVTTTGVIGALVSLARSRSDANARDARARETFPRNTRSCTSIYGRRCDYLDVCSRAVDPWTSPLYAIKPRKEPTA